MNYDEFLGVFFSYKNYDFGVMTERKEMLIFTIEFFCTQRKFKIYNFLILLSRIELYELQNDNIL